MIKDLALVIIVCVCFAILKDTNGAIDFVGATATRLGHALGHILS